MYDDDCMHLLVFIKFGFPKYSNYKYLYLLFNISKIHGDPFRLMPKNEILLIQQYNFS